MKFHKILLLLAATVMLTACGSQPDLSELEEWDLVWISDSSGWGVAKIYAAMVEEDTGIPINVHDNWVGHLPIKDVLDGMRGTPTPSLTLRQNADLIREAEIVVIYGNPNGSINERNPGEWDCVPPGPNYVNSCEAETFDSYVDDLKAVYDLIFELRADQPTIVRTFDAYNPLINEFKEQGVYEECRACWAFYNAAIYEAAAAFNIPVAQVVRAWNGPNFDQDPSDLGYVKDGIHPNEVGAEVIAQAIRETGYQPVEP